ncbi:MAG: PQQ-binding-like beta-propeller repeat protein, partial [Terriglobia bacterium]
MRFSPLQQINRSNVQRLQRAWTYQLARTPNSGIVPFETTPLMVHDVLYFATPTGRAIALDAETGKRLWVFDPFRGVGAYARPVVNRGVAYWEGTSRVTCSGAGHGEDSR